MTFSLTSKRRLLSGTAPPPTDSNRSTAIQDLVTARKSPLPMHKGERRMHNMPPRHTRSSPSRSTRGCFFALTVTAWLMRWMTVTAQGTPATAFVHVNVIDGTGAPLKADQTVVV